MQVRAALLCVRGGVSCSTPRAQSKCEDPESKEARLKEEYFPGCQVTDTEQLLVIFEVRLRVQSVRFFGVVLLSVPAL